MPVFTDQLDRKVEIPCPPKRIISLVPSQSELLWDLGLREEIAGITKFCIHPDEMFSGKPRVGGTKQVNCEKINELQPDLIIANKEENEQEQVEALMKNYPVWISDIKTLDDALNMIRSIGEITNRAEKANHIANEITKRFHDLPIGSSQKTGHGSQKPAIYIIWKNPYMCAGKDTFIDHLMGRCGLKNVITGYGSRYPEMTLQEIAALHPGLILLSSEPYPFKQKHMLEFQTACPTAKVLLVDGEMFSWYGSRLLKAPDYFRQLLSETGNYP